MKRQALLLPEVVDVGEDGARRLAQRANELAAPEWAEAHDQEAVAYVRTYDVELTPSPSGLSSIEAIVHHVRAFGPVVRLELNRVDNGGVIEAHIARAHYERMGISKGQRVYVSPTSVRVFAQS